VLIRDSTSGVRRLSPKNGSYEHVSHVTTDGRPRLFDHILVSEGIESPGAIYDTSVLGAAKRTGD
jgi:hypothetical protein